MSNSLSENNTDEHSGIRAMLVGDSVVLRIEDGWPDPDELLPHVTLTPTRALKLAACLVRYAWRAAANARRGGVSA